MRSISLVLILSITIFSCNSSKKDILEKQHQYTNELINETSPYLLQHVEVDKGLFHLLTRWCIDVVFPKYLFLKSYKRK